MAMNADTKTSMVVETMVIDIISSQLYIIYNVRSYNYILITLLRSWLSSWACRDWSSSARWSSPPGSASAAGTTSLRNAWASAHSGRWTSSTPPPLSTQPSASTSMDWLSLASIALPSSSADNGLLSFACNLSLLLPEPFVSSFDPKH